MKQKVNKPVAIFLVLVFLLLPLFSLPGQAGASVYGTALLQSGSRGDCVKKLQTDLNSLGYNTYGIDGIFGPNTRTAIMNFQRDQGIIVDGIVGSITGAALERSTSIIHIVQSGDTLEALALRYGSSVNAIMTANRLSSHMIYIGDRLLIPRVSTATPSRGSSRFGELADWWTVASHVFYKGKTATVTDVDTGISYRVIRSGGSNHADCQPLTALDAAKMKQARGGYWSWTRRAIIVDVDGRKLAASQNGMPHGGQSIYDNNFPGHFCIHFLNSRTHGSNRVDENHQAMVLKAAGR